MEEEDEVEEDVEEDEKEEEEEEDEREQPNEMFEMFNQTTKSVKNQVEDLTFKVDNSMQLNSALDFNMQQLSQKVDQLFITMNEKITE